MNKSKTKKNIKVPLPTSNSKKDAKGGGGVHNLGGNLSGGNLSGGNLSGGNLSGGNLSGGNLSGAGNH